MTVYKAYDITEDVSARPDLTQEQIENIEIVVKLVLEGLPTNKIYYQVPEQRISDGVHPVIRYNKKVFDKRKPSLKCINEELDCLAGKLLFEEQVEEKDGSRRRNKKIKEGLLFAKHTPEELILLKFEEIKIMDKATFKPIEGLSIDKQYYKIVVIKKNSFRNITVVDRNKVIAKYWASGFLELERQRDAYVNTIDLIASLEQDKLISTNIGFTDAEYQDVKQQIRDYIFESKNFDKDDVFSSLTFDHKKYPIDSNDLFEKTLFSELDADFDLSKEAIIEKYKRTIRISKSSKLMVDNLYKEIMRDRIEMKGNKLILTIDGEYKDNVKNMLESEMEREWDEIK